MGRSDPRHGFPHPTENPATGNIPRPTDVDPPGPPAPDTQEKVKRMTARTGATLDGAHDAPRNRVPC